MSDRFVLEKSRAQSQIYDRQSAQMRNLMARANRGAIRTAAQQWYTPVDLTKFTAALSLDMLPGRWSVTGEADFIITAPSPSVAARLTIAAFDPSSGLQVVGDSMDFPNRGINMATTGSFRSPITVTGSFVGMEEDTVNGDGILTISLMAWDELGNSYQLWQPRLLLMPW